MSGCLTPYDKKAYRESKRRRKQALKADKTGRIMPFSTTKRRIIIAISITVTIFVTAVCGYFLFAYFNDVEGTNAQYVSEFEEKELLMIVSQSNPLDDSYVPHLENFEGYKINTLMLDSLKEMYDDANSEGINLKIINAYIPFDTQQEMYEQKLEELLSNSDYTLVRAESEANRTVPKGGNSEFQTGLLVDFDINDAKVSAWLELNCVKYGFILRYPEGSEDVCNHTVSNSIYRYVGRENAVNMRSYNMILEDYNLYLETRQNQ
ncbi:MAG: M15 family metallopeptidase [Ruminococcus sp.]|nr:M15 family metallopeptidase [Ruminococcus sp.]